MKRINNYDDFAEEKQKRLQQGTEPPHIFVEKPAMRSVLPNLKDMKILLIGCGTGEETIMLEEFGAENITGVDISKLSISLANSTYPQHSFQIGDMNNLEFDDNSFDFVYSSLAIHYSPEPLRVYKEVCRILKPGGVFQFSTLHPIRWASVIQNVNGKDVKMLGYSIGYNDKPDIYGDYLNLQKASEKLLHGETIEYWVGPPSMHFKLLKESGYEVVDFLESKAIEETKETLPYYYERFSRMPQFVVFKARKL